MTDMQIVMTILAAQTTMYLALVAAMNARITRHEDQCIKRNAIIDERWGTLMQQHGAIQARVGMIMGKHRSEDDAL